MTRTMPKRSVRGMKLVRESREKGFVTESQFLTIVAIVEGLGTGLIEVRPATYCGPGSAGDRGEYVVSRNGSIVAYVGKEGRANY